MQPEILDTDTEFTKKWKSYVVWNENNIKGFFGEYRFLSNFQPCDVYFEGDLYPSSEHAYMAAKSLSREIRDKFTYSPLHSNLLTCSQVKKLGKTIELRPDWDNIRCDIMLSIVFDKFWRNKQIRNKLLETGMKHLEEMNHWNDLFWGTSYLTNQGLNNLGKILMKVRDILK